MPISGCAGFWTIRRDETYMKVSKKVIGNLEKCYSVAPLHYAGKNHFLVAAEKVNKCLLFDIDGVEVDTVWSEPGGVMTMVQVPKTDGQFLATHKFYSPNDSGEAKIVIVTPVKKGEWQVRTLVDLPHVHRFDILERNGVRYLIACTLKSGHEFKEDWSMPGKVYGAVLPENLEAFDDQNQLTLTVLQDNMLKNHGYYRVEDGGVDTAVISCEGGIYQFAPPKEAGADWEITKLLDKAASDAVLVDLDGDGEKELAVLAPFHGEQICIYKRNNGVFEKAFELNRPVKFLHAVYGGMLCGKSAFVVGHRQGERDLLLFTWNSDKNDYEIEILDHDCGPANIMKYSVAGADIIIATNREIDEIAMYTLKAD